MPKIQALLVQNNPDYIESLQRSLQKDSSLDLEIFHAATLKNACERISQGGIQIILLELALPDSSGLETFSKIHMLAPDIPVVILSSIADEMNALRAVQKGAQDYLLKSLDEDRILFRVIRCALERQKVREELKRLSFLDDLTGLYNRRGFFALAEQQMKLAQRTRKGFLLMMMDLDEFKQINDLYGHSQGDEALRQTAQILRKTFRQTDLLGRVGGDEFCGLAIDASRESSLLIYHRLAAVLEQHRKEAGLPYTIEMSAGVAYYQPESPTTLQELFDSADQMLYRQKNSRSRRG